MPMQVTGGLGSICCTAAASSTRTARARGDSRSVERDARLGTRSGWRTEANEDKYLVGGVHRPAGSGPIAKAWSVLRDERVSFVDRGGRQRHEKIPVV